MYLSLFGFGMLAVKPAVGAWVLELWARPWPVTEHVRAVNCQENTWLWIWLIGHGGLYWLLGAGHISPSAAANWDPSESACTLMWGGLFHADIKRCGGLFTCAIRHSYCCNMQCPPCHVNCRCW